MPFNFLIRSIRWFRQQRLLVLCIRFLFIYALALFIAKFSFVFRAGVVPGDLLNMTIIAVLLVYRFISVAVVPGLVLSWVLKRCAAAGEYGLGSGHTEKI